jgi:hypothetical protein
MKLVVIYYESVFKFGFIVLLSLLQRRRGTAEAVDEESGI